MPNDTRTPFNAIICGRWRRYQQKICGDCKRAVSSKLCDFVLPTGEPRRRKPRTCDAPICTDCADHVEGKDLDYCKRHARKDGHAL
jgi:hypothetical protein